MVPQFVILENLTVLDLALSGMEELSAKFSPYHRRPEKDIHTSMRPLVIF